MQKVTEYLSKWFANMKWQFSTIEATDIIDILLLSVLMYYVYRFIRDRRAGKLAAGVLVMLVILIISEFFDMYAMQFIFKNFFQVGLIALLIIFQPEMRAALEKVGGEPFRSLKSIGEQRDIAQITKDINAICEATAELSRTRTGALIVIERSTRLGDIVKSGVELDASINSYILRNIFYNKAPLHDGAVIIRGGRIHSAGCFLPLSQNTELSKDIGTRHRAAIGITEVSDAVVVVVSEETGYISLARNGLLERAFNYQSLKQELTAELIAREPGRTRGRRRLDNGGSVNL